MTIAENPLESSVVAVIDVAGVNSGEPGVTTTCATPTSSRSRSTRRSPSGRPRSRTAGDGEYKVTGDLTIKDVTRPVTLDLEYLGTVASPWGDQRAGFSASTEVSRKDWGLKLERGARRPAASSSATRSSSTSTPKRSSRSKEAPVIGAHPTGPRQHVAPWSTSTRSCRA